MATTAFTGGESVSHAPRPRLDDGFGVAGRIAFGAALVGGLLYAAYGVISDTSTVGESLAGGTLVFLGLALLLALGFEFVNGFHDTANAVATVIYTRSMSAPVAVVWAGVWNFLGVMFASGAVAYSIIALLPVDLLLNVGSGAGFAMIFALLIAAIGWNLATWYVGLPNSSSHALIGSILGVGLANQLIVGGLAGTAGVDWSQARKVFTGLLLAPVIGFIGAFVLLKLLRAFLPNPELYREPGDEAPPRGIRALLIATCTAVSFAHGSNDGQKGMGLIMLILIGCAPTAYALNRTADGPAAPAFVQAATSAEAVFERRASGLVLPVEQARGVLTEELRARRVNDPRTFAALDAVTESVRNEVSRYGGLQAVPASDTAGLRNDMYLIADTSKYMIAGKGPSVLTEPELVAVSEFQDLLQGGTRYIPGWVKVAVALALGLGTMVGWKRIVVTVGEKIGKTHMTYGMGASAELMAASTILLAERFGLPVSTTHILSSGVAGASVANGAGLQRRTITNMALAWVTTLPATMALSGGLYWLFLRFVG
ncbi:inorganic phosphate transporter [Sphingomonas lenta]|uniref:Phosphate transporter n=1 Tax=Sphingomonas lenta TaxID=1141887 RepID=A0A2A2SJH0_9SPHN|nr:inorganic phosphate transporter [Sphingomonas lenta]PAX09386.1 anion permease [Sphingomonas lenta]